MKTNQLIFKVVFLAGLSLGGVAVGCSSSSSSGGGASCSSLCASAPSACSSDCNTQCTALQNQCANAGQSSAFDNFASCGPTFTCNGSSSQVTNCQQQAAGLLPCLNVTIDGGGPHPDGGGPGFDGNPGFDSNPGFDVGPLPDTGPRPDVTPPPTDSGVCMPPLTQADCTCDQNPSGGACVGCCQMGHMAGTQTFIAAVQACECTANGGTGVCQTACATEFCANPPVNVTAGDACDMCLGTSLNTGGMCVTPVTNACTGDCISYLNCANGCPNTP